MSIFSSTELPQNSSNKLERQMALDSFQEKFQYDFSAIENVPISATLPEEAKAGKGWSLKIVAAEYNIRRNWEALIEENNYLFEIPLPQKPLTELAGYLIHSDLVSILNYTDPNTGIALKDKRPKSFDDYRNIFKKIPFPKNAPSVFDDQAFADYFISGLNPVLIETVTTFPENYGLTDEILNGHPEFKDDSIDEMLSSGRLFVVDYKELKNIEAGIHPDQAKYIYSPIVYLAIPQGKKDLEAVAVQFGQDINTPIATPQSGQWDWLAAKTMSKVATVNHHEYLTHLGLTHLLIDPIVVATFRQLPPQHPVNTLLLPHFEGTLPINALGVKKLLFRDGTMDRTFAGKFEDAFGMLSKVRNDFQFRANFLPKHIERRRVSKDSALKNYPYRDDGLAVWNAISKWVNDYINLYYQNDDDVLNDYELAAWAKVISDPNAGRINDFAPAEGITTKTMLIENLTMIIFTSSAQHAAVNFPQATTAIASLEPGAGYAPMPTELGLTEQDALDFLPPLDRAIKQTHLFNLLGNTYYTQLGQYQLNTFSDKRVVPKLWNFQKSLKKVEKDIESANKSRRSPYEHLKPSKIPQSINI